MNPDSETNQNPIYQLQPEASGLTEQDVRNIVTGMMMQFSFPSKISSGFLQSQNFVSGSSGWQLRPDGAEVNGAFAVTSIDIPNTTTANSFHTDASGNSWWGANVATGYTGANAAILANGGATFKNVQIGGTTVQYVITNSGIFSYGDGSDGDVTISSNQTLTRDMYYRNLTINSGAILITGGYRIFCSISLTMSGASNINYNGNAASGTTPGSSLAAGYFTATAAGGNIGNPGTAGGSVSNALGGSGGGGGGGGGTSSPSHAGTGAGAGGTASPARVKLIANWHLATLLDVSATGATALFTSGGGGGGGGIGWGSGTAGAGGSAAGIVAIYAKTITIGSGCSITANGGNGADANLGVGQGGGGGGGGSGGLIVLNYNTLSNSGSLTANGGTQGNGGPGGGTQLAGGGGNPGSTGAIFQFQLSF